MLSRGNIHCCPKLLVHQNLTALEQVFEHINGLDILTKTVASNYHSMNSFFAKIQTHVTLFNQISNSLKEIYRIFMDTKRHKSGLLGGTETIFKALIGNLDAVVKEYFTDSNNTLNKGELQIENLLKN